MSTVIDTQTAPIVATDRPMQYLPVALFGAVMGLSGLSGAWRLASRLYDWPVAIAQVLGALAIGAFIAMTVAYVVKVVAAPDKVRAEYEHPVTGNLFGTFLTSLLLLPLVLAPLSQRLAEACWVVGTIGLVLFAWRMVDRWTTTPQHPTHATPAWIVPVVGLLDVPVAVPAMPGLPALPAVLLFGLAVGLFFAIPVFTLVFARLLFQEGMPPALQPTLLILVAPFSVGATAYAVVTGQFDLFAQALYMVSLFLLVVLAGRLRHLMRCCPFRTGWWATSFPLAACAGASLRYAAAAPGPIANGIAVAILALASAVIGWLAVRTVWGISRGELKTLVG